MTKDKETRDITVKQGSAVAAPVDLSALQADAGKGSQNITVADKATPILSVLQSNSPQCKRTDGKYIPGAVEGSIYNNVTGQIYDGEAGIEVVPAYFEKVYIEWRPNRGGLVAVHPADTPLKGQVQYIKNAEGKEVPTLPSGNQLIETNQHYVLLAHADGKFEPAVISMAGSQLSASRRWNYAMDTLIETLNGVPFRCPTFYGRYALKTVGRTKDQYSWAVWTVELIGKQGPGTPLYEAAKAFEQAVSRGAVKVQHAEAEVAAENVAAKPVDDSIPF